MTYDSFRSEISNVSIQEHYAKPKVYGLTFHQVIKSKGYSDAGWIFMLWDFNDSEKPGIHITTFQSDETVAKGGVFTLDDFFVP